MGWHSFRRALLYGRRVSGPGVGVYLIAFVSAIVAGLMIVLLGLATDLFVSRGTIRLTGMEAAEVPRWAGRPDWSTATAAEYERRGMLPTALRWGDKWYGGWTRWLYRHTTAVRTNEWYLLTLVGVALALAAFEGLLLYLYERAVQRRSAETLRKLRLDLHGQALKLGASDVLNGTHPDILELFRGHAEALRRGLLKWQRVVPLAFALAGGLILLALVVQFWLAVAPILLATLGWIMMRTIDRRARERRARLADDASRRLESLNEPLRRAQRLGGYMSPETPGQPFDFALDLHQEPAVARDLASAHVRPLMRFVVLAGAVLLLGLAGTNVAVHSPPRVSAAEAAILISAIVGAAFPLLRIARLSTVAEDAEPHARAIFAYLDRASEVTERSRAGEVKPLAGELQVSRVTLVDAAGRRMLDDVTFSIPAGMQVAFVSSEPATPRAIVGLFPRCYDPTEGRVLIDGHDIRRVQLESLRSETAMVLLDGLIEGASVMENITGGDPRFAPRHARKAARWVNAYSFIQRLPQGFETIVGPDGHRPTPSETVRIGLARTLMRHPSLVVVEEPAEEYDAETAALIGEAVQKVARHRTMIVLARQLSTLRQVGRVYLFHQGKLHAEGSHAELLQTNDLYRHLQYVWFNEFRAQGIPASATGASPALRAI